MQTTGKRTGYTDLKTFKTINSQHLNRINSVYNNACNGQNRGKHGKQFTKTMEIRHLGWFEFLITSRSPERRWPCHFLKAEFPSYLFYSKMPPIGTEQLHTNFQTKLSKETGVQEIKKKPTWVSACQQLNS